MTSVAESVAVYQAEMDRMAKQPVPVKPDPNPTILKIAAMLNKLDERGLKTAEMLVAGLVRLGGVK